jgi:DNA transformation protein
MASGFRDLLEELFAPLGGVNIRRMFGGLGVFREGIMFGLVADDVLYMKTDESTSPAYRVEGSGPFIYDSARGRTISMPYWRLPERLYDDPDAFREWALAAFAVAEKRKSERPKKGKAKVKSPKHRPKA